jgi:MFS family permease
VLCKLNQIIAAAASIFFVAQFCTAIMWGRISDRYGRRPVLLTGLIGNALSSCLFGLSKNLWWAIGSRALCGIMNGNSGVARSLVSEITDNTNKAKAFAMFGFCWGAGMIGKTARGK